MKNKVVLGLAVALGGASTIICSAHAEPRQMQKPRVASVCAYTPSKGSTTRKQIADALRRSVGQQAGIYAVFVFKRLRVNGSWAFAQADPQSPDEESHYEPVAALLRRKNGLWSVVARADTDEETTPAQAIRRIKKRFPSAPRDIFPS